MRVTNSLALILFLICGTLVAEGKALVSDKKPAAPSCSADDPLRAAPGSKEAEELWRKKLTPEQYRILREGGTEHAFTGKYWNNHDKGMYACAACGAPLFKSDTKFDSGTGWPSFWESVDPKAIELVDDFSYGMHRVEVRCAKCHSHLGHLFEDGPKDKSGKRFCINSESLEFKNSK